MAAVPSWLVPLRDDFTSDVVSPLHSFKPSEGPTIHRARTSKLVYKQRWAIIVVGKERFDELAKLYEFTSLQGTQLLTHKDFITQESSLAFIRKLVFRFLTKDRWRADMEVEVYPTVSN